MPPFEEISMQNFYFQRDGAAPHTARETMAMLREAFPDRLIYGSGDMEWPIRDLQI